MRPSPRAALLPLVALAACHASVNVSDDAGDGGGNVHIAMGDAAKDGAGKDNADRDAGKNTVSLKVPGFSANVTLPKLDLGGHVDLDGIRLAPGTDVRTVDVQGDEKKAGDDTGNVRIAFTHPGTPASLIAYYDKATTDAGYHGVTAGAGGVSATKGDKQFALSVAPDGAGSRGAITLHGAE